MVDSVFQGGQGMGGTHNSIMSSAEYLSTAARSFNNIEEGEQHGWGEEGGGRPPPQDAGLDCNQLAHPRPRPPLILLSTVVQHDALAPASHALSPLLYLPQASTSRPPSWTR
jgi:hypothetical protein